MLTKNNLGYVQLNKKQSGQGLLGAVLSALVGALVAVAAMIAVSVLGLTGQIVHLLNLQKFVQTQDPAHELLSEINQLLADPAICTINFRGINPTIVGGIKKVGITDASTPAKIKFQVGGIYLNGQMAINELSVGNYIPDNGSVANVGKVSYNVILSRADAKIPLPPIMTGFALQTTLDGANNILNCYALGVDGNSWQHVLGSPHNIYYAGGNVGVGTTSPAQKFEVQGGNIKTSGAIVASGSQTLAPANSISIENGSGFSRVLAAGPDANTRGLLKLAQVSGSGSLYQDVMIIQPNGNVGIAQPNPEVSLDVNGQIRAKSASAGQVCPALGAQAYEATSGAPLYCNNSSPRVWALSAGGASGVPSGILCGSVFWQTQSAPSCSNFQNAAPCLGQHLMSTCGVVNCPRGYSPTQVAFSIGSGTQYHQYSCVKN